VFNDYGFKKEGSSEKDCKSWKGQGDWEETWGETYSKKRISALFVVNISRYVSVHPEYRVYKYRVFFFIRNSMRLAVGKFDL